MTFSISTVRTRVESVGSRALVVGYAVVGGAWRLAKRLVPGLTLTGAVSALATLPAPYDRWVSGVMAVSAVTCAVWAEPAPGSRWAPVYKVLNILAVNFYKARNQPPHSGSASQ